MTKPDLELYLAMLDRAKLRVKWNNNDGKELKRLDQMAVEAMAKYHNQ